MLLVVRRRPATTYILAASVAQPGSEGSIIETAVADEVDKRIGQFAHQTAVWIRHTAVGVLAGTTEADKISGAVHDNAVYLLLGNLGSLLDVQRALFHELLHDGLQRWSGTPSRCVAFDRDDRQHGLPDGTGQVDEAQGLLLGPERSTGGTVLPLPPMPSIDCKRRRRSATIETRRGQHSGEFRRWLRYA